MRKLHFLQRAPALVAFPGGYGTFDELFEVLTLVQTRKIAPIPIMLVGEAYWRRAVDFDFLVEEGVIDPEDRELFWFAETARGHLGIDPRTGELARIAASARRAIVRISFHGADRGVTGSCHLARGGGPQDPGRLRRSIRAAARSRRRTPTTSASIPRPSTFSSC